jgi:hypothetical protein
MAEPASAAAATVTATTVTVPVLSLFGVSLGLHPGLLIAGAFGAFVGIVLLNTVPGDGKPWWYAVLRRMLVMIASSVTAGYLTPVVLSIAVMSDSIQLGMAFVVGGSAQWTMLAVIKRVTRTVEGAA